MRSFCVLSLMILISCGTVSNNYVELATGFYELGQLYEQEPDRQEEAITQYKKALELYPNFENALYSLSILYIETENYAQVQELMDRPFISGNTPLFMTIQAYVALAQSDYAAAERIYMQLIEEDKAGHDTYYNLGVLYREADRETDSIEQLNKALELNPGFIPAHEQLALFSFQNDEYVDVIVRLEKYIGNLEDFPLGAILLGESFVHTENYAGLFPFMERLYEKYEDGSDIPPDLSDRYERLLIENALNLGIIAIDDERSLRYFTIVGDLELLSDEEWKEMYDALKELKGVDETIAFISEQLGDEEPE